MPSSSSVKPARIPTSNKTASYGPLLIIRLVLCRRQSQPCSASPLSNHLSTLTPLLRATLNFLRSTGGYILVAPISPSQILRLYRISDTTSTATLGIFCSCNHGAKILFVRRAAGKQSLRPGHRLQNIDYKK